MLYEVITDVGGIFPVYEKGNMQGLLDMGVCPEFLPGYQDYTQNKSNVITSYSIHYTKLYDPDYFASMGREMVSAGASLVGGCCGTTPEHIRALSRAVAGLKPSPRREVRRPRLREDRITSYNVCYTKLLREKRPPLSSGYDNPRRNRRQPGTRRE